MSSVNKAVILGNLVRDPETRHTQSGDLIVNMTVATNETWKDKRTGERKEKAEFHRVVIFNENLAKIADQYLRKGSRIFLEGQLQTRKWTDQQGVEKYTTEVVIPRFKGELTLLDSPKGERQASYDHGGPAAQGADPADLDDTIPFVTNGGMR